MTEHDPLRILRPKPGTTAAKTIDPESGVVTDTSEWQPDVLVYYEGNRYDAINLRTLEQRVLTAADRCISRYPTIACGVYPSADFDVIGMVDRDGTVRLWKS